MMHTTENLLQLAWTQLWQVTVVIVLVATAARLLRPRSHLVYLLWLVVLVKCLTPPMWSSPTGVFSWTVSQASPAADSQNRDTATARRVDATPATLDRNDSIPQTAAAAAEKAPTVPGEETSRRSLQRTDERAMTEPDSSRIRLVCAVVGLWAIGMVLYVGWVAWTTISWSRLVRAKGRAADVDLIELTIGITARLAMRPRVKLVVLPAAVGPLTFGLMRPTIVLPECLLTGASRDELEPMLAHELVHVRRRDTLIGLLQVVAQAIWWFHPLVWWSNRQMSQARERCCDEEVVATLAYGPADYSRSLLKVLSMHNQSARSSLPVYVQNPVLLGIRPFEVTRQRIEHLFHGTGTWQRRTPRRYWTVVAAGVLLLVPGAARQPPGDATPAATAAAGVGPLDWPQWGGSGLRNNAPHGDNILAQWNIGPLPADVRTTKPALANVRWIAQLGSQCYNAPVIAGGQVYIGTNNGAGYLPRYPAEIDLGVLLCLSETDGKLIWQHSNEKLPTGRVHDWPLQGVCSAPLVEGDRLWYVSNRGEVVCLDTQGFHDGEDDGPVTGETGWLLDIDADAEASQDLMAPTLAELARGKVSAALAERLQAAGMLVAERYLVAAEAGGYVIRFTPPTGAQRELRVDADDNKRLRVYQNINTDDEHEADVVWRLDMMRTLGVSQHNMCSCSVTAAGDILFVNTSNGTDGGRTTVPAPGSPSFIALDKRTGRVLWTDNSPGGNVLNGQWSSPAFAVLDGVPQVIFGAGDGWVYSFRGDATHVAGRPELLWKFDCNPKDALFAPRGRKSRNHVIGTPVIYDGLVYVAVGDDPEKGEGAGHLWCIDPKLRGDVSPQQVFAADNLEVPLPHRRLQAADATKGDVVRDNPNSAAVWHYASHDINKDGKIGFEETMHRTIGTVALADGLLYIADFSGIFHCLDAKTGVPYWTADLLAEVWASPLIVDGKVFIGDSDGTVAVFKHGRQRELLAENSLPTAVYGTAVVANNTLFVADQWHLFAIGPKPAK